MFAKILAKPTLYIRTRAVSRGTNLRKKCNMFWNSKKQRFTILCTFFDFAKLLTFLRKVFFYFELRHDFRSIWDAFWRQNFEKTAERVDSISKLSGARNILSPQKCRTYPSWKTLFFVSRFSEYFARYRSIWAQEFRDCTPGCTRALLFTVQSVVVYGLGTEYFDIPSKINW